MLIQSLRNMMKPLMWATLILIIPSFIALYGYQGLKQKEQRDAERALTVSGAVVDIDTYQRVRNNELLNQRRSMGDRWYDGLEQELDISGKTVDALITQELLKAKAQELGVRVSDKELQDTIKSMFGGGNFNEQWYLYSLARAGIEPQAFEASLRPDLAAGKVQELIQLSYHVTEPVLREQYRQENTLFRVEYLEFLTRDSRSTVKVDEEGLAGYFEEHKTEYQVPEKVRLRYVRLTPRDFESQVRVLTDDKQEYYDQNRPAFEIPEKVVVEEFFLPAADFVSEVTSSETVLEEYFRLHRRDFRLPEHRAIRYTYVPLEAGSDSPQLPLAQVREFYAQHLSDYQVRLEELRAQQILVVLAPDASPGEEAKVLDRLREIRAEIEGGLSFEEAAGKYSEDQLTKEKGGDLGWFGQRNFQLGRELTDAAFELGIGGISEPIRTSRGYHLLRVVDRKPERTRPLEEVEEQIRRTLASQRMQQLRFAAKELGFREEILGATYPILQPEPFSRTVATIDDVIGEDSLRVASAAFGMATGEISTVIEGKRNLYLIELAEIQPERERALEDAGDEVREAYVNAKAKEAAQRAGAEALDRIRSEGMPFSELAGSLGKQVRRLGPFRSAEEIPELVDDARQFAQSTQSLEGGRVTTVATNSGVYLVRVVRREEARIPELAEVEAQVERAVRREKAVVHTEEIANDLLSFLEEKGAGLADAIRVATEEMEVRIPAGSLGEVGPIGENDPVNLAGWGVNVTKAGLRLEKAGDRCRDPIPVRAGARAADISDFVLIELMEKIPEHEPTLAEVRDRVERDYRAQLASELATRKAEEAFAALREAVAGGELAHASKTIDLVSFARRVGATYNATDKPFSVVQPPWDLYGAEPLLKTIDGLREGEISGLVKVSEPAGSETEREPLLRGYYIVQVIEKKEPAMDQFAGAKERMVQGLQSRLLREAYESWIEALKRKATVVRHEALERSLAFERGELREEEFGEEGQ